MKTRLILLIFGLMAAGCSSNEFDDSNLLTDLSGAWYIQTPYIGLTVDGNYSKVVQITFPEYQVEFTSTGKVFIYLMTESGSELISKGTVSGISKKKLRFNEEISSTLKTIGFFEGEDQKKYSIINRNTGTLEINYTFTNSSGQPQDEGFYLRKLGAIP